MRDLDADLELCNAATPGPWTHDCDDEDPEGLIQAESGGAVAMAFPFANVNTVARNGGKTFNHANARFIAESREGWLWAICEIKRLRGES